MRMIDLTRKIYAGMPVYPGDPGVSLDPMCTFEDNICQVTLLRLGSHTGTHLDAPRHFLPDGKTLPELPLDIFVGEAVCVRARIYYATQVADQQPTIVLFCNDPKAISAQYQRYLLGLLRDRLKFAEVPIKLYLRRREHNDARDEMAAKQQG